MVYTGKCESCGEQQGLKFFAAGGGLIIGVFGFFAVVLYMRYTCTEATAKKVVGTRFWIWLKGFKQQDISQMGARLKILWTCYQIIAQSVWILPDVEFPAIVETAIQWVSALTVFSFDVNMPLNCIYPDYNYYHNVLATNVSGPAFIFILVFLAVCLRRSLPPTEVSSQRSRLKSHTKQDVT